MDISRRITNRDPGGPTLSGKIRKTKDVKSVWYEDSVVVEEDVSGGGPSRYGPRRDYIANFRSVEMATEFVILWNARAAQMKGKR